MLCCLWQGGAKISVTQAIKNLIKKFAHPMYSSAIDSYPSGCCTTCKLRLYDCKRAADQEKSTDRYKRDVWQKFKMEDIRVPRISGDGKDCQCSICHVVHYNPVGVNGHQPEKFRPMINPSGGLMECEKLPKVLGVKSRGVTGKSMGLCILCGQVTGRGKPHPCSKKQIKSARCLGRVNRGRSLERISPRKKRNLSLLVGRESIVAQEEIVNTALNTIGLRKGHKFRLKQMGGGGKSGYGKEIVLGSGEDQQIPILPIEVFQEIKKGLNESKRKMEDLCRILRRHKVKMTSNVQKKLAQYDNYLEEDYETFRVKFTETVTIVLDDDKTRKNIGRQSTKGGQKTERREIEVEKDLTVIKDIKNFVSKLIEERGLWEPDILKRISIDGGGNSLKMILNTVDKHADYEVTFPARERKGRLLSGVDRSILLAYCEDLQENYNNILIIFEILEVF